MGAPTDRVTIRHTPNSKDVDPYTFTATRKAWDAGCYPRSQGFELVSASIPASTVTSSTTQPPLQTAAQLAAQAQAEAEAAAAAGATT